jgi:ribosomal protein S18 acetylase RimI-like enzyme
VLRPVVDVRLASPDDRDDLVALWVSAREEIARDNRATHVMPVEDLRDRLGVLLEGTDVQILIGRREGASAGYVVMSVTPVSSVLETRVLLIEHLFVHPQHRRAGLAKAMLGAATLIAERARIDQIVCNVAPAPRETHRFFARLGFSPMAVRRIASTGVLRRRLAGEQQRRPALAAIEDLAFRRRSRRERNEGRGERAGALTPQEASGE